VLDQEDALPARPVPPVPERRPTVLRAHGDERIDDWYWLKNRDDPAVLAHLEAENAYAEAVLAPLVPLRDRLFEEIKARIAETDLSVPVRRGPWWYYDRTEEGKSYPLHCRRPVAGDDPPLDVGLGPEPGPDETLLLDENALAEGHGYLEVANLSVSPDHRWLAYATDTTGAELYDLSFRPLAGAEADGAGGTGSDAGEPALTGAPETVSGTSYGLAWANDNATVFYTRVDAAMRPYQLWRHRLGTDPAGDTLVLQEDDERFTLSVGRTKNGAFIAAGLHSHTTSEWRVVPADEPTAVPRPVAPRRQGIEYSIEHHRAGGGDGWFVITTNDGAEDFRVMAAPAGSSQGAPSAPQDAWVELVPHRPGVRVEDVDVLDDWLVVAERLGGEPVLRIVAVGEAGIPGLFGTDVLAASRLVPSTGHPAVTWEGPNPEPATRSLRIEQTSLTEPRTVSDLDLGSGTVTVRKRQPVLGGYDPARYRACRLWATAPDGARVPLSAVYRADLSDDPAAPPGTPPSRPAPCLLYGYGAYEHSIDPVFSSLRLSLLDRGVVFAIAHVRGGGELGRRWYLDGKAAAKAHTFSDFVACGRHLVETGFTTPDRLAARGGSAGGLLMGALVNEAPDLFSVVVAEVPFVDCLTTMLDESLPLTVGEFEEWGDPIRDPAAYATIKAYSPYDNVRSRDATGAPVRHPRIFATAGLNDPRVGYWEPAKWVARLRAEDPGATVVLRTELGAGHGGPSGRYETWRDEALVYAFVLDALGVDPIGSATGAGAAQR
jgi:oligopeptidase B